MTHRGSTLALVLVATLVASCVGEPAGSPAAGSAPPTNGGLAGGQLPCGDDPGYPCTRAETDPRVREAQAGYAAELVALLEAGSREAAEAWIREQDGVVESYVSDTLLMFRLAGSLPLSIITPIGSASGSAAEAMSWGGAATQGMPQARLASALGEDAASPEGDAAVVGVDTDREHPRNHKHALFLEPWATAEGTIFNRTTSGIDPTAELGTIQPDFDHPDAITHYIDGQVTPDTFSPDTWRQYDFIYVSTHGASWPDGAVLETGVRRLWDGGDATYHAICDEIIAPYQAYRGVECGVEHADGRSYVTVDVTHIFFLAYFLGDGRQLDRAIVVIEACESLKYNHLALAIVGTSSAYLGWTDFINLDDARESAGQLLVQLTKRGRYKPVGAALETVCDGVGCGGENFKDPTASGDAPWLRVFNNGPEALDLRLYALPTPRDPDDPTSILEDGSELRIEGTPGDGAIDRLEVTAEIVGVIDPDEAGNGPGGLGDFVLASSHDVASLYDVSFYIGDEVIGSDNLGSPREGAEVVALDATTYRYRNTFFLPFDVDPEGTDATFRVVVDLPEGGISDYEIGVTLVGGSHAIVQVGNTTWEFDESGIWQCFILLNDSDQEIGIVAGAENADGDGFSAQLDASGGVISVRDARTGADWHAIADRENVTVLHLLPAGSSQIDTITIEDGHATGLATFIDANAAVAAWRANWEAPAWPDSVPGTFDILCGG